MHILTGILVALGAVFMASSIVVGRRLGRIVSTDQLPRWRVVIALMYCFLASYILFIAILVNAHPSPAHLAAPPDYRAQVFQVTDCPQDPVGDRFPGLDHLLTLMGSQGQKLYRSVSSSGLAGPTGIIASDDVVVIKINYQWGERGGTNTDLLRGLIRAIVDHPDTFTGEVVVCENAQFNSVSNFDRTDNNAQDTSLSPHDVVVGLQNQGYTV